LNGQLIIESAPGHGTTLYVEIPLPTTREGCDEPHSAG
jgi:signal transduction histidine kinase